MNLRHLDLFSGIGGFSKGLRDAGGFETVGFCECEPFCRAVLAHHWPGVEQYGDIRMLIALLMPLRRLPVALHGTARRVRGLRPDIITGGVPCQPASVAGNRRGSSDERWMWPHFLRVVRVLKPLFVLAENVPGLISLEPHGLAWVVGELERAGYECCPFICGARHIGAPHRRDRIWILGRMADSALRGLGADWRSCGDSGHADQRGAMPADADRHGQRAWGGMPSDEAIPRGRRGESAGGSELADAAGERRQGAGSEHAGPCAESPASPGTRWPSRPGEPQHDREPARLVKFQVGSDVDGVPVRLARFANRNALRAVGNSVIPEIVEAIGRSLIGV